MSPRTPLLRCLVVAGLVVLVALPAATAHARGKTTVLMEASDEELEQARRRPPPMVTARDEERAGAESAKSVAAQIGLLDNEELKLYVQVVGDRLLRGLPRRSFKYRFDVVDQEEPNAFALPGGYIFITRGLLALAQTEDEVANVIGHEIMHVALHHAMRQQALQQNTSFLVMGYMRYAMMSRYSRDMEREADREGQKLAAAAGYDPRAMGTFMESLGDWVRVTTGQTHRPTWFDSHPSTAERAAVNLTRAGEMRWRRDPKLGDTHVKHLRRIDGIPVGERPQSGMFEGNRFLHPDLDFQLRFPNGWRTSNQASAVGAQGRDGSVVFLTADVPKAPPQEAAEQFLAKEKGLRPQQAGPDKIRGVPVWHVQAEVGVGIAQLMFLEHQNSTWLLAGVAPRFGDDQRQIEEAMRSFRTLTPEQRAAIRETNLRIVEARAGEDLAALSAREKNTWDQGRTAVANGVNWSHAFAGGELVKVAESKPYRPKETP